MRMIDMVGIQPLTNPGDFYINRFCYEEIIYVTDRLSEEDKEYYLKAGKFSYSVFYSYKGSTLIHDICKGFYHPCITFKADHLVEAENKAKELLNKLFADKQGLRIENLIQHKI